MSIKEWKKKQIEAQQSAGKPAISKLRKIPKIIPDNKIYNGFEPDEKTRTISEEFMRARLKNKTRTERKMRTLLDKAKLKYVIEQVIFISATQFYIADFYLPNYTVIIEVDGGYHNTPEQQLKDQNRTEQLSLFGFIVIRIDAKYLMRKKELKKNKRKDRIDIIKFIVDRLPEQSKSPNIVYRKNTSAKTTIE